MPRSMVPGPLGQDIHLLPADRGTLAVARATPPGTLGVTSDFPTNPCAAGADEGISAEQGQRVVDAARSFVGAEYFSGGGAQSTTDRMDCSGAVWLAYRKAGFPTRYHDSRSFPNNTDFFRVPDQRPQQGDVGQWSGHMLIFDAHAGGGNNGWSARRPSVPFSAQNTQWWAHLGTVTWYRYKLSRTCTAEQG
jgi:hypothetical protein